MSEISELIIPSMIAIGGIYLIKRYTEDTGQGDFTPLSKTCIGPICWSSYGPPISPTPGQGGIGKDNPVITNPIIPSDWDPLQTLCNWPGSELILPPCYYKWAT